MRLFSCFFEINAENRSVTHDYGMLVAVSPPQWKLVRHLRFLFGTEGFTVLDSMTMVDTVEVLGRLLRTCRSTEDGFRRAAQATNQPDLRRLFETYAKQRARFANQLEIEVVRLGGIVERPDAGSDRSQRMRARFSVDPTAAIQDCASMEEESVRGYQEALSLELPPPIQHLIERQIEAIAAANDRLHAMQSRSRTVA